jgi:hypothetical protein
MTVFWGTLFVFCVLCVLLIGGYALRYGIGPVPTSPRVRRQLLKMCPELPPGSTVVELGSGWGTLAFSLARHYPSCTIIAYEISPIPWLYSQLRLWLRPQPNLILCRRDFFSEDLSKAQLVVCYLYPGAMRQLSSKLSQELRPGANVLSHTFSLPGWVPSSVETADDIYHTSVYLYACR